MLRTENISPASPFTTPTGSTGYHGHIMVEWLSSAPLALRNASAVPIRFLCGTALEMAYGCDSILWLTRHKLSRWLNKTKSQSDTSRHGSVNVRLNTREQVDGAVRVIRDMENANHGAGSQRHSCVFHSPARGLAYIASNAPFLPLGGFSERALRHRRDLTWPTLPIE